MNNYVFGEDPNFIVEIAVDALDPDPAYIAIEAYDEYDAIDSAACKLLELGKRGYFSDGVPEFPDDYIQVSTGDYLPVQNVSVRPL